jgi:hypothetical protein
MSRKLETPEFELGLELDGTVNDRPENKNKSQALIQASEEEKFKKEKLKNSERNQANHNRTKGYYLSGENHKWLAKEALRLSLDGDERYTASSLLEEIINKYRGKSL